MAPEQISYDTASGVTSLRISATIQLLRAEANRLRAILAKAIALREKRGGGLLFTRKFYSTVKKIIKARQRFLSHVKKAISIVLEKIEESASMVTKKDLIELGKAVASIEFAFLDILLSFEQSKPPHKTRKTAGLISDEEAKKLIMAEHRNLGLSQPDFGQ